MVDTVTVYRWDDVDAPQILNSSRKPSDIMNVLKACLVDGYGSKLGVGWSVVEDQIATAAPYLSLRNAGSGGVATLSQPAGDVTGYSCILQSHQDYTDKNNNAKSSFTYKIRSSVYNPLQPSLQWIVIATDKAFWMVQNHPSFANQNYWDRQNSGSYIFFCGDVYSVFNNDPATFTQITGDGAADRSNENYQYSLAYTLSDSSSSNCTLYAIDNSDTKQQYYLRSAIGASAFNCGPNDGMATINVLADMFLAGGSTFENAIQNDSALPLLRGRVPGLFISDQSGWRSDPFPVIKTISGSDYIQIPDGYDDASATWIKLDTWQ